MKTLIVKLVAGALIGAAIPGILIAQRMSNASPNIEKISAAEKDLSKKTGLLTNDPGDKQTIKNLKADLKSARANLRATSDFDRQFANASDVQWVSEEEVITVSFIKYGNLRSRATYDKNGNLLYSVVNYYEQDLPEEQRSLVTSNFPNMKITLVQEIKQGSALVYKIHLENDATLKHVLISDGEVIISHSLSLFIFVPIFVI